MTKSHAAEADYGRGALSVVELEDIRTGPGDHIVQFYERESDLVGAVSGYLAEGLGAGETAVVVATEAHRRAFGRRLAESGVDVAAAIDGERLVWLDAAATLAQFRVAGTVDRPGFHRVIGGVLRHAAAQGRPIRAYGEMVALLWDDGYVTAAIELEQFWNELRAEIPASLFCAYRSESVSGSDFEEALRHVCCLHSAVLDQHSEHWASGLGPAEATEVVRDFGANPEAPRAARRFVVDQLRREGYPENVVDDAALVLTELAANALVHARSAFTVTVSSSPPDGVRVAVRDRSAVLPMPRAQDVTASSGRGLSLVAGIASGWGTERTGEGKVVWAELRP